MIAAGFSGGEAEELRRIKAGAAGGYILSQIAGATIAGLILAAVFNQLGAFGAGEQAITGAQAIKDCMLGTPNYGASVPMGMAILVEILLTALLVFAIFGTAVDERAPKIGGFGIGLERKFFTFSPLLLLTNTSNILTSWFNKRCPALFHRWHQLYLQCLFSHIRWPPC